MGEEGTLTWSDAPRSPRRRRTRVRRRVRPWSLELAALPLPRRTPITARAPPRAGL